MSGLGRVATFTRRTLRDPEETSALLIASPESGRWSRSRNFGTELGRPPRDIPSNELLRIHNILCTITACQFTTVSRSSVPSQACPEGIWPRSSTSTRKPSASSSGATTAPVWNWRSETVEGVQGARGAVVLPRPLPAAGRGTGRARWTPWSDLMNPARSPRSSYLNFKPGTTRALSAIALIALHGWFPAEVPARPTQPRS